MRVRQARARSSSDAAPLYRVRSDLRSVARSSAGATEMTNPQPQSSPPLPPTDPTSIKWLIWSNEHEAWWRPNGNGYTMLRAEAGEYGFAKAVEICAANTYRAHLRTDPQARPAETMFPVLPTPTTGEEKQR
jgi:hypothetical protein